MPVAKSSYGLRLRAEALQARQPTTPLERGIDLKDEHEEMGR